METVLALPITVVICTMDRSQSLRQALRSVVAEQPDAIVIVDQSRDDASKRVVESFGCPRVHYVHSSTPGLSRAYNLGIRTATTELLAFTDDDCTVPTGWLSAIKKVMAENPDAALVYGQVRPGHMPMQVGDYIPELTFTEVQRFARGSRFQIYGMGANAEN